MWALIKIPGAAKGLRYYLVPDFHNLPGKYLPMSAQVMFSVDRVRDLFHAGGQYTRIS